MPVEAIIEKFPFLFSGSIIIDEDSRSFEKLISELQELPQPVTPAQAGVHLSVDQIATVSGLGGFPPSRE